MSIPFFNSVMKALGKKLSYDAISNLYGNAFAKEAGKIVAEHNPLIGEKNASSGIMSLLKNAKIPKLTSMKGIEWAK